MVVYVLVVIDVFVSRVMKEICVREVNYYLFYSFLNVNGVNNLYKIKFRCRKIYN